ncbi:MAG: hypothetical protein A2486_02250 [Burkholderiales bacterium RIFOXYC12_FULL_65_23]|uniref:DNA cytosine methyltransferase n=1 Tax=Malikia spinosa TaxID=86180 RepID=UPI0008AE907F|nr:MAG: hypothetical protein A2486_02250 [Burkholderiales bacterium RIFOXYC12_FULL_65_23]
MTVPVIDLFAGPGGLGEGFSRSSSARFEIAVSIEKDPMASQTLRLRAAHRALQRMNPDDSTWELWDETVEKAPWNELFGKLASAGNGLIRAACEHAQSEVWNFEMSPLNREQVSSEIRKRLSPYLEDEGKLPDNLVLIGGPPCQAYSHVGRARNRGNTEYRPEEDHRHFLYLEYLHVISEFRPAVFVMENVKGILSSKVSDRQIFYSIMSDLRRPGRSEASDSGPEYVLVSLSRGATRDSPVPDPEDFIVEAERYGVPQARHRVIVCGIRRDVFDRIDKAPALARQSATSVGDVLADLPELRPMLSHRGNGMKWSEVFELSMLEETIRELSSDPEDKVRMEVASLMARLSARLRVRTDPGTGADRKRHRFVSMGRLEKWFRDRVPEILSNHETKAHMPSDLLRYFFVAAYGEVAKVSPRLSEFPRVLLPEHRNVDRENPGATIFKDRFRVQLKNDPSMTVTSHMSKDGHAFIHYDPLQCRSLTVREAARLQTFPDSYVFLGSKTSQYTQVGNAVPPYLAKQIADTVGHILQSAGMAGSSEPDQTPGT